MGDLRSALDELAADDLRAMPTPEVMDRLRELLVLQNRIAAEVARTVRAADLAGGAELDGLKTMPSWLRGHGHLSPSAASTLVRNSRALDVLTAVAAAFADGAVTADQVTVIAPVATERNLARAAAQDVDLPGADRVLAETAVGAGHQVLARTVHHYLARLDPDGPEPDPTDGLAAGDLPTLRTVKPATGVAITLDDLADPAPGPGAGTTAFEPRSPPSGPAGWPVTVRSPAS